GRIGWHIECYVMSKILGHPIDIKGGGLDLVFPHHESTKLIASALGEELSKFYMHNAFLTYNKQKMSKSKGICVSISDGLESHDRETLRFFLLGLHYRKNLNYTDDDVVDSATKLGEIKRVVKSLARSSGAGGGDDSKLFELTALLENEFYAGMEDDLDTPRVLDALSDFASSAKELDVGKSSTAKALEILGVIGSILGFDLSTGAM
ncbi:MAG: class I tRNA ligase family protein, partial [Theionarchaea archaeon]|nr:class I tRNA ligase family protein [Theionarchaea archaeon]